MSQLRQKIEQEIREHGPIPSRYMELCLYDPEFGLLHARTAGQFGKAGDFYTSSDVHDRLREVAGPSV